MSETKVLKGHVVSGARKAAFFTQLDWVVEQCARKLGFRPFPGTLNIEIQPENHPEIGTVKREKWVELIPTDSAFCSARAIPVTIEGLAAALILPEEKVRTHGRHIVEVIAPVKLRAALNIDDGDVISMAIGKDRDDE
jgi:CTP-dependent riboflavin kinase